MALEMPLVLNRDTARSLCRSGEYRTCRRYLETAAASDQAVETAVEFPWKQRLVNSALWVIGIPVAITILLLLAMWITERLLLSTPVLTALVG